MIKSLTILNILEDQHELEENLPKTDEQITIDRFTNFDLTSIVTPINADRLEYLLKSTSYDEEETKYLVNGFRNGFDIKYHGPTDRQDSS